MADIFLEQNIAVLKAQLRNVSARGPVNKDQTFTCITQIFDSTVMLLTV